MGTSAGHWDFTFVLAQQPWDGTWGRRLQGRIPPLHEGSQDQEPQVSVGTLGEAVVGGGMGRWWHRRMVAQPRHGKQIPWGLFSVSFEDCAHIPSLYQGQLFKVLFSGPFPWKILEHLLKHFTSS